MTLGIKKCFVMTFSTKRHSLQFSYVLQNNPINRCDIYRNLGISFDPRLSFGTHIGDLCGRAMRSLGFIIRNSNDFQNTATIKKLYLCYIRPILEYGSVIWNPIYDKYIGQMENVQRKFIKYLVFKSDGVYPPRGTEQSDLLLRHKLPLLVNWRKYFILQFLFKLLNSLIDCPYLLNRVSFHVPSRLVRSAPVFHLGIPKTHILSKTPLYTAMQLFNRLCDGVDIHNLSLSKFRNVLSERLSLLQWRFSSFLFFFSFLFCFSMIMLSYLSCKWILVIC